MARNLPKQSPHILHRSDATTYTTLVSYLSLLAFLPYETLVPQSLFQCDHPVLFWMFNAMLLILHALGIPYTAANKSWHGFTSLAPRLLYVCSVLLQSSSIHITCTVQYHSINVEVSSFVGIISSDYIRGGNFCCCEWEEVRLHMFILIYPHATAYTGYV